MWRGSVLITKPKTINCMNGMPRIIANVRRSRDIWMNSFTTMAHRRANENPEDALMS